MTDADFIHFYSLGKDNCGSPHREGVPLGCRRTGWHTPHTYSWHFLQLNTELHKSFRSQTYVFFSLGLLTPACYEETKGTCLEGEMSKIQREIHSLSSSCPELYA